MECARKYLTPCSHLTIVNHPPIKILVCMYEVMFANANRAHKLTIVSPEQLQITPVRPHSHSLPKMIHHLTKNKLQHVTILFVPDTYR